MSSKKYFIYAAFCAILLTGCVSGNSHKTDSLPTPPKTAQYAADIDWLYPLNDNPPKALGSTPLELGSVTSVRGATYATSSLGKVIAIDEKTAKKRWIADFGIPVTSGPVVTSQAVFVALSDGAILRLAIRTGEVVWRYETGAAPENSLSVRDGVVACVNSNNRVFVLDEETGALKWRRERPKSSEFAMYGQSSPLIDQNGNIYAGFSDGFLVAYASNGTAIWSRELAPNARFKDLDVNPIRMDDTLYVASSSGGLYALSVNDGHTLWQRDILGISAIVPFQDSLYVASQSGIFRLRRDDGATIWQNIIQKDALISSIQLGRNNIYASVQRYGIIMVDRRSGDLRHVIDMGSDFTAAPYLTDGALTAISNKSTIYRFIVDDTPLIK